MRIHLRTVGKAAFLALSLAPSILLAQDLTAPLTSDQVSCNGSQLAHLLARIDTSGIPAATEPAAPAFTTLVSYSNASGFYEGIALTNQGVRTSLGSSTPPYPENYLAWNLNPSLRTLLLNPARPPLGQVELAREETSSNLTAPGSRNEIFLTLDPTLGNSGGSGLLRINNFLLPLLGAPYNGYRAASTAPGSGLAGDGLLTRCHGLFTAQDRKIFALLERMVRVSAVKSVSFLDAEIAIYRGEDPHLYRADIFLFDLNHEAQGKVAASLVVNWTSTGTLTNGTLSILPACTTSGETACSAPAVPTEVLLIAPVLGGSQIWGDDGHFSFVDFDPVHGASPPVAVDFATLLRDTRWND
jgi:hypothetical protein